MDLLEVEPGGAARYHNYPRLVLVFHFLVKVCLLQQSPLLLIFLGMGFTFKVFSLRWLLLFFHVRSNRLLLGRLHHNDVLVWDFGGEGVAGDVLDVLSRQTLLFLLPDIPLVGCCAGRALLGYRHWPCFHQTILPIPLPLERHQKLFRLLTGLF